MSGVKACNPFRITLCAAISAAVTGESSALLTTSMGYFKVVLDALQEAGVRDCVKVAIGGAPVTQAYADEIGADLFTEDAVSLAGRLLEEFA